MDLPLQGVLTKLTSSYLVTSTEKLHNAETDKALSVEHSKIILVSSKKHEEEKHSRAFPSYKI